MAGHSGQAELQENAVFISIYKMLRSAQISPDQPCISEVPYYLRKVREEAYEPQVISIGPYHRGKPQLQAMEQQKIRFLLKLLEEEGTDVSVYVQTLRELEDEARKCYAADLDRKNLESADFVTMLLLDGVFLVQMIRLNTEAVPIYLYLMAKGYSPGLHVALLRDMLLVENQLPYFVLRRLFCMIESRADKGEFIKAIFRMLKCTVPGKERPESDLQEYLESDFKHLLDFAHHCCWHPSTSEREARKDIPTDDLNSSRLNIRNLLSSLCNCCCYPSTSDHDSKFIPSATQLREAGIKFKLFEEGKTMFDIKFENGTLHIPKIKIGDFTDVFSEISLPMSRCSQLAEPSSMPPTM